MTKKYRLSAAYKTFLFYSTVKRPGMRLADGDYLESAYLLGGHQEYTITYHDKPYSLNKVRLAKRDTKGVKPRV